MLPLILLAALLGPGLGLTLGDAITGLRSPSLWSLDATASRVTLAISLLATVVSVFAGWMHERLTHAQAQAEAARRAQAESQLRLLQSQLEPHMLFNTLANLRVLIGLDATRAQAMLDRLIAYLRATLQASRAVEHPLAAEFERIADYLALMQVRMGPRLAVSLDLPAELRALPVPPLILQPLVENSIQHGLEPQVEGGRLTLSAALQSGRLRLTVRDDGIGLGAGGRLPHSTGFGLEQVRSRLHTLYGSAASLALSELPGERGTLAVIELPLPSPESTLTPSSTAP
ncbi:MAG: histidine kinase [Rubrivivax sp.]|nr:histidine kinase [Rubrivivax sp.]